jgi:hypothetical protein
MSENLIHYGVDHGSDDRVCVVGMKRQKDGSWLVVSEAHGDEARALAEALGMNEGGSSVGRSA